MPSFLQNILWPKGKLAVALSGGKDSVALLALAKAHFSEELCAFHMDHQARSQESCLAECESVDRICQKLDIPLYRVTLEQKLKTEAAWREARYKALAQLAQEHRVDWVATAHHQLDQAETILMHLFRGTNLNGLCGMPQTWTRDGQNFCRPLLHISPEELYPYLASQDLEHFEDPSNQDTQFKRNDLRKNILPLIESFQKGSLSRLTQITSSAQKALSFQEEELKLREKTLSLDSTTDSETVFSREQLKALPSPLLDLWCKRTLIQFAGGASKINRPHIENLVSFIKSDDLGYYAHPLPGNIQVRAQKKKLIFKSLP